MNLSPDALTVKDVCNLFLTTQLHKVEAGEIDPGFARSGSVGDGRPEDKGQGEVIWKRP